MAGDPHWNSVVLAMHMDGANASTVFSDQKGKTVTAVGNAQISTAQSKFGGASALFDGTGDYLTVPTDSTFDLGSGDFTIELWVRLSALTSNALMFARRPSVAACGIVLLFDFATSKFTFYAGDTDTAAWNAILIESGASSVGSWNHFAVVRSGNVWTIYKDGVSVATTTASFTVAPSTVPAFIGASDAIASFFTGNLDDLRITKGVARYTANFTPPALAFPNGPAMVTGTVRDSANAFAPRAVRVYRKSDGALSGAVTSHATTGAFSVPALDASLHYAIAHDSDADPHWPNVVLATHFDTDSVIDPYMGSVVLGLHMEGANASTVFQDVMGKTVTAVGNAQISTAQAKFGNSSVLFDGTGDYLSVPTSTDFDPGVGAFTVDGWYRFTTLPAAGTNVSLVVKYNGTGNQRSWFLLLDNTAGVYTLKLSTSTDGTSTNTTTLTSSAVSPSAGVWYHIAWVRTTGVNQLFFNGVRVANQTSAPAIFAGTATLALGASSDGTAQYLNGYMDDLRITKGIARYTADYTPPAVPFSSFKDLKGNDLMVGGVPSISTATKKYGDASLSLNGPLSWLAVADSSALRLGATAPCTIEFWVYLNALPASSAQSNFVQKGYGATNSIEWQIVLANNAGVYTLQVVNSVDGTATVTLAPAAVYTPALSTWIHIAYCKDASTTRLYINGVLSATAVATSWFQGAASVSIGGTVVGANPTNGYIDDIRITKGVARYQTDFTPPERAFAGAMTVGVNNAMIYDDLTPV